MNDTILNQGSLNATLRPLTIILGGVALFIIALGLTLQYFLITKGYKEKLIHSFRAKINQSDFLKTVVGFFNPDATWIDTPSNSIEPAKENKTMVIFSSNSNKGVVKNYEEEIPFDGRRILLLLFFYNNKDGKRNYNDFNNWLSDNGYKKYLTDSRVFRQEIIEINGRLTNESKYIFKIIQSSENSSNNKSKANLYQYKIKSKI